MFLYSNEVRSTAAHVPQYRYRASLRYTFQGRLTAGFSKVCEIFKVCVIESLKYIKEFHTTVCYCGDISMPRNVKLNKTNCDWLFDMSVKRPHGWALTNECSYIFQTFSRQSEGPGYARLYEIKRLLDNKNICRQFFVVD